MPTDELGARVVAAHGDAWQVEGRLREAAGGGATDLPGIRLMASGLPHPQWNNGDVTDAAAVDLDAVRAWFAARHVPWGVRVPSGMPWPHGRHLFAKRLMGLPADDFRPAEPPADVTVRLAGTADEDDVLTVDLAGFGGDPDAERRWVAPHLDAPEIEVALARVGAEPVGTAYAVRSDDRAGPAVYLAGVAVVAARRRRGIARAMSAWLLERAFDAGARLGHLHPDDDAAAAVYAQLGFVEVPGFDIYVDL